MNGTYSSTQSVMEILEVPSHSFELRDQIDFYFKTSEQRQGFVERIDFLIMNSKIPIGIGFAIQRVIQEIRKERIQSFCIDDVRFHLLYSNSPKAALEEFLQEPINDGKYQKFKQTWSNHSDFLKLHKENRQNNIISLMRKA